MNTSSRHSIELDGYAAFPCGFSRRAAKRHFAKPALAARATG
jgi:hypothetical protein